MIDTSLLSNQKSFKTKISRVQKITSFYHIVISNVYQLDYFLKPGKIGHEKKKQFPIQYESYQKNIMCYPCLKRRDAAPPALKTSFLTRNSALN